MQGIQYFPRLTPETVLYRNIQLSLAIAILFSLVSCDSQSSITPPPTRFVQTPSFEFTPTRTPRSTSVAQPNIELLTPTPPTILLPTNELIDPDIKPKKPTPSFTPTKRFTEVPYPDYYRWVTGSELASEGKVFITVDDCNDAVFLARMVKLFIANGIRVTFFPNTNYIINQDPQLWRDAASIGQMGYHTTDHNLTYTNPKSMEELEADYAAFQKVIFQKTGLPVEVARAPYGAWTANFVRFAQLRNLLLIKWTAAPSDLNWNALENTLKNNGGGKGGGVLIFHSTEKDALWLEANIGRLKAMQFNGIPAQFLTINQVFR